MKNTIFALTLLLATAANATGTNFHPADINNDSNSLVKTFQGSGVAKVMLAGNDNDNFGAITVDGTAAEGLFRSLNRPVKQKEGAETQAKYSPGMSCFFQPSKTPNAYSCQIYINFREGSISSPNGFISNC